MLSRSKGSWVFANLYFVKNLCCLSEIKSSFLHPLELRLIRNGAWEMKAESTCRFFLLNRREICDARKFVCIARSCFPCPRYSASRCTGNLHGMQIEDRHCRTELSIAAFSGHARARHRTKRALIFEGSLGFAKWNVVGARALPRLPWRFCITSSSGGWGEWLSGGKQIE